MKEETDNYFLIRRMGIRDSTKRFLPTTLLQIRRQKGSESSYLKSAVDKLDEGE